MPLNPPISAVGLDFASFEIVANRRMVLDGVEYNTGDPLPDGLLHPRRARQMYEQRRIALRAKPADNAPEKPQEADKAPEAPQDAPKAPEPAKEPEKAPEPGPEAYTKADGYFAYTKGGGWWHVVDAGDNPVSGPHRKDAIEHLL